MANAKKCDRCGKFYDGNTRFPADQYGLLSLTNGDIYIESVMTMTTGGYHYKNYDLCDDCIEDFKKFINGRKLVEEE